MKRVFILHMLPLEYYPPVTNLLDVLTEESSMHLAVFSTHNTKNRAAYSNPKTAIFRTAHPAYFKNTVGKMLAYIRYVLWPLWRIIRFKPDSIVYFEPHSAMPAYVYQKFLDSKVQVFIHHHEYYAKAEFNAPSMAAVRWFHRLETGYLYLKARWISQTNAQRQALFKNDHPYVKESVLQILPNYPPQSWLQTTQHTIPPKRLKLLYIGALSFENTYIKELVGFVLAHSAHVTLDIYAYNTSSSVKDYLHNINANAIRFFEDGIAYNSIPELAKQYHVGVVLYKGHNLNYIYNAPNKLFEYMACGLEVWVPMVMTGCQPYLNRATRPVVRTVDYTNLNDNLLADYQSHLDLPFVPAAYSCNAALQPLIKALKKA